MKIETRFLVGCLVAAIFVFLLAFSIGFGEPFYIGDILAVTAQLIWLICTLLLLIKLRRFIGKKLETWFATRLGLQ